MEYTRRRALLVVAVLLAAGCAAGAGQSSTTSSLTIEPTPTTVGGTAAPVVTIPSTTTWPPPPGVPIEPQPDPTPPDRGVSPAGGSTGVAVVAAGGADLFAEPTGPPFVRAHEGLVMAVEDRQGDLLLLRTMCDETAWVQAGDVEFTPTPDPLGEEAGFDQAVVVLDPGHGGVNRGAQGPTGLREEVVNLDIARRARDLLQESHLVDWSTGTVYPGDAIPPVGKVWVTRTEGPPGADYEAGLLFRATLAGRAGAAALISIHNNAGPDGRFDGPGSETFYMFKDPASRRLGGLLVEEMRRSFAGFDVEWMGDTDAGAKYRLQEDGETDYYGILRRALVPSVIAEGAFISSAPEEALLATAEFRQAYAEAIYRALVRFITTDDPGSGFTTPYLRTTPVGSGDARPTCQIPAQP
jgi:N-acetylmuramoyl-L-alanine amidase